MTHDQLTACLRHGEALARKGDPDGGMILDLVAEVGLLRESLRDHGIAEHAYEIAAEMLTARATAQGEPPAGS